MLAGFIWKLTHDGSYYHLISVLCNDTDWHLLKLFLALFVQKCHCCMLVKFNLLLPLTSDCESEHKIYCFH